MKNKKYLVDTCKGSKYYNNLDNAIKAFWKIPTSHTLAERINNQWYIIIEKQNQITPRRRGS